MELIFKKYHRFELHTEKNYLIYDPSRNQVQFTKDLFKSISKRNFGQSYENILIGPIMEDQKMTVKVLGSDGTEISTDTTTEKIFQTYLKDQGYADGLSCENGCSGDTAAQTDVRAFGTVYYFPA